MSIQIRDTYKFENKTYYLLASNGRSFEFKPHQYHLHPTSKCTACWSGYFCEYEIKEQAMYLDKLYVHHENDTYPELNGVSINQNTDDDHYEHYHYDNLNLPISGRGTCRMLLGADCVECAHVEINDFWNYETLKELTFKKGNLIAVKDYSSLASLARTRYQKDKFDLFEIKLKSPKRFLKEILSTEYKEKLWWVKET